MHGVRVVADCETCGKRMPPRRPSMARRFCSSACSNARRVVVIGCANCQKSFRRMRGPSQRYCSRECGWVGTRALKRALREENAHQRELERIRTRAARRCEVCKVSTGGPKMHPACRKSFAREYSRQLSIERHVGKVCVCKACGQQFAPEYGTKKRASCSTICDKVLLARMRRDSKATRRARKRGAFVQPVGIAYVRRRDKDRCGICHQLVDVNAKAPAPLSPSIDHILPLSRGGSHEPRNVRLAHLICNSRRGAKGVAQLRMVG